jgi:putative ABC transport system permease protein
MRYLQSFLIALEMLRQHKMRAFLTMLGVIIGVMSVTMIVMISSGFQSYINGQFAKIGSNSMFVFFDPGRRNNGQTTGGKDKLTMDDLTFILNRVQDIDVGTGMASIPAQTVRYGSKSYDNPRAYAADVLFKELNQFELKEGRSLSQTDLDQRANVAVIGEDISNQLFGDQSPLGKLMILNGIALQVIGVVKKADFLGDSNGRLILVPITTAQAKWVGGKKLDMMLLRPKAGVDQAKAMDHVWEALMIRSGGRPIYRVDSNESIMQVFTGIIGAAGVLLAGIAALSLLVGGIGIMNIMLVSVTERTREIGLRKAIGAPSSAILQQFLIEAATLSLIGGLIGMLIAWMLGNFVTILTALKEWPNPDGLATPFPFTAAIGAALFSAFIGVVFGLYPALSASKLDPIVALRHE